MQIVGNNAVTYSFIVTTDGPNTSPCAGVTQQIDIEVVPASTLVYAGADPSVPNQTVCSGTPLTDIEFRIGGGARDVNVSGTLFTAGGFTRAGNVVVNDPSNPQNSEIYGVAPVVASTTTFTYEITTINQCNPGTNEISYAGVITVLPEESLTVRPANGAVTQQVCYGEDLTPIVIDVVGDNTFASAVVPANIPNGVNFNFVEDADNMGGVLTISGSPSDAIVGNNAVTYSFIVTTDGPNTSPCAGVTQQIDIEVVPASTLVYAGADPSVPNQTVCSGTPLTDIEFRIGGGARDVNVSGTLFTAGGFTRAGNVVVNDPSNPQNSEIYGVAPVVASTTTFTYEITTINQCNPGTNEISYAGVITVLPSETIVHRGASGATTQDVCINQNITPIIYDVTGQDTHAKFVDASLVPSGISLDFAPDQVTGNGGVATILGSPDATNAAGDYTFEITTAVSGGVSNTSICADQTQSITISVKPLPTMVFSGADPAAMNQSVCQETAITPIEFTLGGGANDVTFSSSPAGLGFTRAANVSVDGNNVRIFGTAPVVQQRLHIHIV